MKTTCCEPLVGIENNKILNRKFRILTVLFLATGLFLFSGCALIGAYAIAMHATCKVKINKRCVKGSCELFNGVLFERLTVLKKDSLGMPAEYIVTERFTCYNQKTDGIQKYWPDKIFFKKPNGDYKWKADTIDIHLKLVDGKREVISIQKKPEYSYDEWFIFGSKKYDTCPIKFEKDTWYTVKITDQRLSKVYLYIDKNKKYHVYQVNSGVCPI